MLASADCAASNGIAGRLLRQSFLLVAAALCAWTLQTSAARADTTIGVDLDLHVPIAINNVDAGGGFAIRIGQQLHLPLVVVNPEFGFTYASFSKNEPPRMYRGIAGGRIGFGELMRFGVLAHVGFGYVDWEPASRDLSHTGLTYDAGVFFEVTAIPLLNIGVHAIYNRIAASDELPNEILHWMSLGAHVNLIL